MATETPSTAATRVDVRLRALAHQGRRRMVSEALHRDRTASHLAATARLSRPAASQHLALLVDAGLLTVRPEGRHRWYRADQAALAELRAELAGFWESRLSRLVEAAET